jgi:hypothetical protein
VLIVLRVVSAAVVDCTGVILGSNALSVFMVAAACFKQAALTAAVSYTEFTQQMNDYNWCWQLLGGLQDSCNRSAAALILELLAAALNG